MIDSLHQQTKLEFLGGRVRVVVGDITRQEVDAVVNAANSTLMGGAGVDGAIHRAGGAQILAECKEIRRTLYPEGLPTGEAVVTTGGRLAARYVVHTVGPVWGREGGREAELLAACYRNSLAVATGRGVETIAFPAISTGAYGYPRAEAATVAAKAISEFLAADETLREVRLVFFSQGDAAEFLKNHRLEKL
jgi:O-acetyl-ADP-ribose deacetylase (regulator of RNase III)